MISPFVIPVLPDVLIGKTGIHNNKTIYILDELDPRFSDFDYKIAKLGDDTLRE